MTDLAQGTESTGKKGTQKKGMGFWSVLGLMLVTVAVSAGVTVWIITHYIFPKEFKPVTLSVSERQVLDRKLDRFEGISSPASEASQADGVQSGTLQPERYSEEGAEREIRFTERELNALLANNTDLADKLAIDLSQGLASARLLLPMDPDFPVLGGKTLKVKAGLELAFTDGKPRVVLRGISVMGVPIPNAWLGGIKNVDLVQEFGDAGFWRAFADGVEDIRVEEGSLKISLKE